MIPPVIERWLINRAAESGTPLPDWLSRRIERSSELRRFLVSLGKVESALHDPSARPSVRTGPHLSMRIADALSQPRPNRSHAAPLRWLGGAIVAAAVALVVFIAARSPVTKPNIRPLMPANATLPAAPRGGPIMAVLGPMERPLNERWQMLTTQLTTQTRQSVSDFIRALPGLPVGDNPARLN